MTKALVSDSSRALGVDWKDHRREKTARLIEIDPTTKLGVECPRKLLDDEDIFYCHVDLYCGASSRARENIPRLAARKGSEATEAAQVGRVSGGTSQLAAQTT